MRNNVFLAVSADDKEKWGEFVQTVPKLFAQAVPSFGWFWGDAPRISLVEVSARMVKEELGI